MFGGLPLGLAALVAVFRAGFTPFGLQIGTSAVVVFYIISGYAMTGLVTSRF
jgi:peptidoglycan/LPS O-acetylase OafA/YrhL